MVDYSALSLTPEQMKALGDWRQQHLGGATSIDVGNGLQAMSIFDGPGTMGGETSADQAINLVGYGIGDPAHRNPGDIYGMYDTSGKWTHNATVPKDDSGIGLALVLALATAGMGGFLAPEFLGGIGAGGSAAGASAAVDPMFYAGAGTGTGVGGGVGAGFTAAEAAAVDPAFYAGSGAGTGVGGGVTTAGVTGGAGLGTGSGAFLGEGMASGVPAWDAAATKAGLSLATTPGAASILSQLGPYAKYALPLLGGLLGSQKQTATQTSTKDIPEWLKPYILGAGGLLDSTQNIMKRQMGPDYLRASADMRRMGSGLLNTPVAGNGFNTYYWKK